MTSPTDNSGVGPTPGPWDASGLTVYDTCLDGVASTHTAADAHLIAAAPELLEALENLTANLDHAFPALANLGPLKSARAAIAKARGQS